MRFTTNMGDGLSNLFLVNCFAIEPLLFTYHHLPKKVSLQKQNDLLKEKLYRIVFLPFTMTPFCLCRRQSIQPNRVDTTPDGRLQDQRRQREPARNNVAVALALADQLPLQIHHL